MVGRGWHADSELPDSDDHDGDDYDGDDHDGDDDYNGDDYDGDDHDGDDDYNGDEYDGDEHDDGDYKMITIFRPELRFARKVLMPWLVSKRKQPNERGRKMMTPAAFSKASLKSWLHRN